MTIYLQLEISFQQGLMLIAKSLKTSKHQGAIVLKYETFQDYSHMTSSRIKRETFKWQGLKCKPTELKSNSLYSKFNQFAE